MKVALLPLDAPGRLSIYGQPVAAEVARTLGSPTLQVVVVGAAMAVPQDAALIVEGSISTARKRVTVELRLRTLDSRTALATVTATERSLATLDRAAAEVARKLLPRVHDELERRRPVPPAPVPPPVDRRPPPAPAPGHDGAAHPAPLRPPAIIAVAMDGEAPAADRELFLTRLAAAAGGIAEARWRPARVELDEISRAAMLGAIAPSPGALGVAFVVRELSVSGAAPYLGKVKARVILTLGGRVLFDRVMVTDSVVGKRKATKEAMLDLLAREVVAILRPRFTALVGSGPPAGGAGGAKDAAHAAR